MIRYIFALSSAIVIVGMVILINILPTPTAEEDAAEDKAKGAAAKPIIQSNSLLLKNVRIFQNGEFVEAQSIRVVEGLITDIQSDLEAKANEPVIDGQGKTLLPGLIDAHTHTYGDGLTDALRFGVSSHLDMFTMESLLPANLEARASIANTKQTDLFSSGTLATVASGHGTQFGMRIDTIDSIDDIPSWINDRKAAGASYIKLVYMPYQNAFPSLDLPTSIAIIEQAKAQNMLVVAHISSQQGAKEMIEANIDGLVHIFADSLVSDEVVALAQTKGTFIVPTLAIIASVDSQGYNQAIAAQEQVARYLSSAQKGTLTATFNAGLHGYSYDTAKQNVKRLFEAGVPILAGSDAPNPGTAYGVSLHQEMALLIDAGLSPKQAISAASELPARVFSLQQRGAIAIGNRADFILLNADPEQDISHTLSIAKIFKNGYELLREPTAIEQSIKLTQTQLGSFNTPAMKSIAGFAWTASDDKFVNGQSEVSLSHIAQGDNQGALKVLGEVKSGFSYPWAGAAVGDFMPPVNAVDISEFTRLVFRIKGSPGKFQVMAFGKDAAGIPPTQSFEVSADWQEITLSLSDFRGFNLKQFSGFSFVAGPQLGKFEFVLDDVRFE